MDPSFLLNNPQLKNISPEKLKILLELSKKGSGNSKKDMLSSLMAASNSMKEKKVSFEGSESDLIINVLKQNMSAEDQKKADMILSMMKNRKK